MTVSFFRVTAVSRSCLAMLVAAGVCWGTGGVIGRALSDICGLGPATVAAYRLILGGGVLVSLQLLAGHRPRSRAAWKRVVAVAALAAVFQTCYFGAVAASSVATATLITIGSAPMIIAIADATSARRVPGWGATRPAIAGLVGLGLLVGAPSGDRGLAATLVGAGLSLLSGAAFAAFTLLGRRRVQDTDEAALTGFGFLLGGVTIAAVIAAIGGRQDIEVPISLNSITLLILLATVPTALAYSLYFRGLRGCSASTAVVVALLEPLTGAVLAVVWLGESLTSAGVGGAAVLLSAVLDSGRQHIAMHGPQRMDPCPPERRV